VTHNAVEPLSYSGCSGKILIDPASERSSRYDHHRVIGL